MTSSSVLLTCLCVALGIHCQGQSATQYVEGDAIVTFKATASLDKAKRVLQSKSMAFTRHFDRLSARSRKQTGLVRDRYKTTAQLIADLKNDASVESAEPNYVRWITAAPNDTRFAEMWALQNTGQAVDGTSGTASADIKFIGARAMARTPQSEIVVGIIDTGVDYVHPDLAPNIWVNSLETPGNSIDDDGNGYVDDVHGYDFASGDADPADSGHHGTHVAGTVAAVGDNTAGVIGVNEKTKLIALKVSTNGTSITTSAVIEALEYATALKTRGVNLVALNGSYGGGGSSAAESAAIKAAGDLGILFCVAAGNETTNNDTTPTYPANYRLANMIVVAATDQNDALASFSNYGATTVDIAAPGSNILSTAPSAATFQAGGTTYSTLPLSFTGTTPGLSCTLVDCGIGDTGDFPSSVAGNIAFIQRGTLTFSTKVTNAMAAGATAAIIYNNVPGNFNGTLQTAGDWIPSYAISQADGQTILAALPMTGSIVMAGAYEFLQGTSMASPHVAGAVAFAAMNHPNETMAVRRQRILSGVDAKPALKNKVISGGRLNLLRVADSNTNAIPDWQDEINAITPAITTASPLPLAAIGDVYTLTLESIKGSQPYSYTVESGSLPDGLTLASDGIISGMPKTPGTATFTLRVTDTESRFSSREFSLTVVTKPVVTTSSLLAGGTVGTAYSLALAATDGTAPYSWTISSGDLPPGVSLTSDGALSGLLTAAGSFEFTVKVSDANHLKAQQALTVQVVESPITITSANHLPYGVQGLAYSTTLAAQGGNEPYTWTLASGTLPTGLSLKPHGVLNGTPTVAGSYRFTALVQDTADITSACTFKIEISAKYLVPVVNVDTLGSTLIGVPYSHAFTASNYPKNYAMSGLPTGLTCVAATGVISGRPLASGTFQVKVRAINPGGSSAIVTMPLVVLARPTTAVGSFTGIISRHATTNANLGSRLTLTTTATGYYTVKVATGTTTQGAVGYMAATAPQISATVGTSLLTLSLDETTSLISGTHGAATVTGWQSIWNARTRPATHHLGYYSVGIDLADSGDDGALGIPQGSGYATFSVTTAGTLAVAGWTADGQPIVSAGFIGPNGEIAVHTSLYRHLGSISGTLTLAEDVSGLVANNTASGTLTWLKPTTITRTYPTTFGPLNLSVYGKYLAPKSIGSTVLGLPTTGTASLAFADGGLHLAGMDPDIAAFSYSSSYAATLPTFASGNNPAKTTLAINRSTGAISGTFTLAEATPLLARIVAYRGQIVRPASGNRLAVGYFLLPQIPLVGETIRTSPILSGGALISQ